MRRKNGGYERFRKMVSVALLFGSRFVSLIGSPLVGLLVVRYLGPDTYGQYASALAITSLFGFLCDFGVQQTVLRFGSRVENLGPVLKRGSVVSLGYTSLTIVIITGWTQIFPYEPLVRQIVAIQCLGLIRTPLLTLVTAGLQLKGHYGRIAFWNLSTTLTQWVATIVAMMLDWSVLLLVGIPIAMSALLVSVMVIVEGLRLGVYHEPGLEPDLAEFLHESWKFGAAGSLYQVYQKGDAAILSAVRSAVEVGHYSVAQRLAEFANIVPGIVFNQVLYPKYFRWSQYDRERLGVFYRLTTKLMLVVGINVGSVMALFGPDLVSLIFQMDESAFSLIIPIFAVGIMLHFWAASPGAILTTDGHVTRKIWIQGITACVNVLLNVLLIPSLGAMAAAAVFAMTQLLLATLYTREVYRQTGFVVFNTRKTRTISLALIIGLPMMTLGVAGSTWIVRSVALVSGAIVSVLVAWFLWLTDRERDEISRFLSLRRLSRKG